MQQAAATRESRLRHWLHRELPQIVLMLVLLLAARDTLANHYRVPSGSMQNTLQVGDRVAVDMRAYGLRLPFTQVTLLATGTPARGDVAVFDSPVDGQRLIKRVVAVAGDRVELREGRLSINGEPLSGGAGTIEAFGTHRAALDLSRGGGADIAPMQVPRGHVLMLGDARGNSFDGRYFGLIPASTLYGRATSVYYRRGAGFGWRTL